MRYLALAADYDGTLAHDGLVDDETVQALERLIRSGRKLILVTGRELPDLQSVFPRLDLCERVVAENGALVYNPATREKRLLAERPAETFVANLRSRGVSDMSVGDVIIATWRPYERQTIEAIQASGLELQIIFNKDAVMILPSGVNKKTGLCSALEELKLSPHNVIGIGDAENDHAFLDSCECSVAVANAIPALKERADWVTPGARGAGAAELVGKLIENDFAEAGQKLGRRSILLGRKTGQTTEDDGLAHPVGGQGHAESGEVRLAAHGRNVLVCGQSGSGKSTVVTGLVEQIMEKRYQICLVDPEGDYENLKGCRTVGDEKRPPSIEHVKQVLDEPDAQVIVNLVGVSAPDRPNYFSSVTSEIQNRRLLAGRPHWLIVDEAHHVLPSEWAPTAAAMPEELSNLMLVTVHPGHVSPVALRKMNTVIIAGREPNKLLEEFANAIDVALPESRKDDLPRGEALLWLRDEERVITIKTEPPRSEHYRHRRKYAEGQLEPERMFHFRGPDGKVDLRAQNLNIFVQLAEGVDAETWLFHLKRSDYSNWIRRALNDQELADEIETVEKERSLRDQESRDRIKNAILRRYTAPA